MEELRLAVDCRCRNHYTDHDMNRIIRAKNAATGELKEYFELAIYCLTCGRGNLEVEIKKLKDYLASATK
jgi:hypothetical protein